MKSVISMLGQEMDKLRELITQIRIEKHLFLSHVEFANFSLFKTVQLFSNFLGQIVGPSSFFTGIVI